MFFPNCLSSIDKSTLSYSLWFKSTLWIKVYFDSEQSMMLLLSLLSKIFIWCFAVEIHWKFRADWKFRAIYADLKKTSENVYTTVNQGTF